MWKFAKGAAGFVVSMFCATALFWAGIAYEHRPAGWPSYTAHIGPFTHTFSLPDSLGAQLATLRAAEKKAAVQAGSIEKAQAKIAVDAGVHDAAAQVRIRVVHDIQIKEIPIYVTAQADHDFPLSWGFVRMLDAAARGVDAAQVPIPAGQSDDAASGIAPSTAAAAVVDNLAQCHADDQQLIDLQNAWLAEKAASDNPPASQ